jgi:hypothetical protein
MKIFIFAISLFALFASVRGVSVREGACSLGIENIAHDEVRAIGEKTLHCIHGELYDAIHVQEVLKNTAGCNSRSFIPPPGPPEPPSPPGTDSAAAIENIFD